MDVQSPQEMPVRQVQLRQDDTNLAAYVSEAEAGETVTILRDGKPVAQIIAFPKAKVSDAERQQAIEGLRTIMDHGYDLGGLKITSRNELYDRG